MTASEHHSSDPLKRSREVFAAALQYQKAGDLDKARTNYELCLKLAPDNDDAWNNLGVVMRARKKFEVGVLCYKKALALKPDRLSTISNIAYCYADLDKFDEALHWCAEAEKHAPGDFLTQWNYGMILREAGRHKEALARFEKARALNPDDIKSQWGCVLSHLHRGDFEKGWESFDIRWKLPEFAEYQKLPWPHWRGEEFQGKTIYVYAEQGFGDTILASRYLPLVKARGGRVILRCKPQLHRLLALPCVDRLFDTGVMDEKIDYQMPLMSLPGIFKTTLDNIPPPPSLNAAADLPAAVAALLQKAGDKLKVGVVWSGSTGFAGNLKRAVHAERFLPLTDIPGVQLFSLQKGERENELDECGGRALIWELGPHLSDFAETAALLKQLDLIIMTDSAVAHLAGTLDVPVWNLLNYNPYWLYQEERSDTPWYPSMRLFRQPKPGDWESVFQKVGKELTKLSSARSRTSTARKRP